MPIQSSARHAHARTFSKHVISLLLIEKRLFVRVSSGLGRERHFRRYWRRCQSIVYFRGFIISPAIIDESAIFRELRAEKERLAPLSRHQTYNASRASRQQKAPPEGARACAQASKPGELLQNRYVDALAELTFYGAVGDIRPIADGRKPHSRRAATRRHFASLGEVKRYLLPFPRALCHHYRRAKLARHIPQHKEFMHFAKCTSGPVISCLLWGTD